MCLPAIVRWYRVNFGGDEGLAGNSKASLSQCAESLLPFLSGAQRDAVRALLASKAKVKCAKFDWGLRTGLRAAEFHDAE